MARPKKQAHGMRYNQSDKADQATDGNGRGRQKRTDHNYQQLIELHMQPQVCRALFSQTERIEYACK